MREYDLTINGNEATLVLPVTLEMINKFRLSTKDSNEIHDPSKTEKPWALGFQLTSILDQASCQLLKQLYGNNLYFTSQRINFRGPVMAGDTIEVKLTADNLKVNTEIMNQDNGCIKRSSIEYSELDNYGSVKIEPNIFSGKPLNQTVVETDISDFYNGLGLVDIEIITVPIPFLLSLLSSTLIKEFELRENELEGKKAAYTSHNISVYPDIRNINLGDSILIWTTSVEPNRIGYNVEISAISREHNLLYQAKVSIALVDKLS